MKRKESKKKIKNENKPELETKVETEPEIESETEKDLNSKMEASSEEVVEVEKEKPKKKTWTINQVTIWRILAYFAIYSFLGFVIETTYGLLTKGQLESRQSFLYGPFCGIYGVGAVIMIVVLHRIDRTKKWKLFLGGFIVGSITEYVVSLVGELLFNVKWWDYSNMFLSIGGRICLYFSIFWGILAIYLIGHLNPKIDRLLDKIKEKIAPKVLKGVILFITIFLFLDCCITAFALKAFHVRMVVENDIDVPNKESVVEQYHQLYDNEGMSNFIHRFFGDKKMIRTFPNLKVEDKNGNMIYFDSLLPDIQAYYFKVDWNLKG